MKKYIQLIEKGKEVILDSWVSRNELQKILIIKKIDVNLFTNTYAKDVIDYFICVLNNTKKIGDCPVMHQMLSMFAEKNISSQEIFMICALLKRSLISFTFQNNIASQTLVEHINYIMDENFSGVIKIYDDIINQHVKNIQIQERKFIEYTNAIDLSTIVVKTDLNGIVTHVNDSFVKVSGYESSEIIGKSHSIVQHNDTPTSFYEDLWKTILSKNVWQGTIKNKKKNGDAYYVYTTIFPLLDDNDTIIEFLSLKNDVTDLVLATQKAQEAELTKSQFLANMSHELRTPLNAIMGFSQILSSRKDTPEKFKDYIGKISIAGNNLLNLVNSILDFSKIEAGKMETAYRVIDIKKIFYELKILIEPQLSKKKLELVLPNLTNETIYADAQLLKQVFLNLITNAIKFTHEESTVSVLYTLDLEQKQHYFSICDQGDGIKEELCETLFEPFYQGENSKKNVISGTGLGLTISYRIICEMHKGKIWVENNETSGACFNLSIPSDLEQIL